MTERFVWPGVTLMAGTGGDPLERAAVVVEGSTIAA